jgi:hypothetical protein
MTKSELRTITAGLQARMAAITNNASKREEIVIQQSPDTFGEVQLSAEGTAAGVTTGGIVGGTLGLTTRARES